MTSWLLANYIIIHLSPKTLRAINFRFLLYITMWKDVITSSTDHINRRPSLHIVCVHIHMLQCACGHQTTIWRVTSHFSPTWSHQAYSSKHFYPLNQLISPFPFTKSRYYFVSVSLKLKFLLFFFVQLFIACVLYMWAWRLEDNLLE